MTKSLGEQFFQPNPAFLARKQRKPWVGNDEALEPPGSVSSGQLAAVILQFLAARIAPVNGAGVTVQDDESRNPSGQCHADNHQRVSSHVHSRSRNAPRQQLERVVADERRPYDAHCHIVMADKWFV